MQKQATSSRPHAVSRRHLGLATLAAPIVALAAGESANASARRPQAAAVTSNAVYTAGTTHAWGGQEPRIITNGYHFELPATSRPDNPRRSELWWNVYGTPAAYREGDVANYCAEFRADLGRAAATDEDWHVIWQLHGATNGIWKGPAQTLTIANGKLRMTGGSGHPAHDPAVPSRYYQWFKDLVPFTNNTVYRLRIQTFLSTNASEGWITAWVNGAKLLDRWRPVSHTGLRPGTILPGQPEVNNRSGLYRGTLPGAKPPTYRQWATHTKPQVF